jgi:CO/xanthine dehydrogenase FAD-binding subunit
MIRDVDPEKIAQEVKSEASPITDIRASSEYRFDLLSVLTARIVRSLLGTG